MAGPERDVRPDQRLDQVQHLVGEEEVQQAGVAEVRGVQLVGELLPLSARCSVKICSSASSFSAEKSWSRLR
ncbi:hypothetical protein [Plantactinospora veratri]